MASKQGPNSLSLKYLRFLHQSYGGVVSVRLWGRMPEIAFEPHSDDEGVGGTGACEQNTTVAIDRFYGP